MTRKRCLQTIGHLLAAVGLLAALALVSGCADRNRPVAILATSVVTGPAPLTIPFDLSHSFHPRERPLTFELDFGDETDPTSGTAFGVIVHHTYETSGTFEALLTVTDDRGEQGTAALTITVSDDGPPEGLEVGMRAPDFTAQTTDGGEFTLSDMRGQVVLIDFWGAWCKPCKNSLPHLDDLLTAYAEEGLVAVLISTDDIEQDAMAYLALNGYTGFISVWEPGGRFMPIAELYGVLSGGPVGIPHTFVLDRQGVIRWVGHPLSLLPEMVETLL